MTGERTDESLAWIERNRAAFESELSSFKTLQRYVSEASAEIDRHPGGWCAVESALLDLFSREAGCSVEALLGIPEQTQVFSYTAVVGDESGATFSSMIDFYLGLRFRDFKFKVGGEPEADRSKLNVFFTLTAEEAPEAFRLRLDANNVWAGETGEAKSQLRQLSTLGGKLEAVEEPLSPRMASELSEIGCELGLAIVLDESLCRLEDLALYESLPAKWIANVKVSKLGGILRAVEMIEQLRDRGWPVIIGAQVGETSVLTRLGVTAARAAGEALWAQEGAFGTKLLEFDPVTPVLQFGLGGRVDLSQQGLDSSGLGLKKSSSVSDDRSEVP